MRLAKIYSRNVEQEISICRSKMNGLHELEDQFRWFHRSPEYLSWTTSDISTMLWHSGPPECGKTTIMCSTVLRLLGRPVGHEEVDVAFFFGTKLDTEEAAATQKADTQAQILRSLICQLLSRHEEKIIALLSNRMTTARDRNMHFLSLEELTLAVNDLLPSSILRNGVPLEELWRLLEEVVKAQPLFETYIIVDEIDWMESSDRSEFLGRLIGIWKEFQRTANFRVRILVSSRVSPDIQELLKDVPRSDPDTERRSSSTFKTSRLTI
jgi:hypothetical protein